MNSGVDRFDTDGQTAERVGTGVVLADHASLKMARSRQELKYHRIPRARVFIDRLTSIEAELRASAQPAEIADDLHAAIEDGNDQRLAELGIDTSYIWLDLLASALLDGTPFVQLEAVSPYAARCVQPDGSVNVVWDRLPADERAGIMVAALFRRAFHDCHNTRYSALLDDFHTDGLAGEEDRFTEEQQDQYIIQMADLLHRKGVLFDGDIPGKDYVLTRERELHAHVDSMIERLRYCGRGEVETKDNGDVVFRPTAALIRRLALGSENRKREFARNGILLRRKGHATCPSLDAAGCLNLTASDVMHVLVLDKWLTSQQDKTYALLMALGVVTQERYENIFYDSEKLSPELITYGVCAVLRKQFETQLRLATARFSTVDLTSFEVD
jgi:hypothetical protein